MAVDRTLYRLLGTWQGGTHSVTLSRLSRGRPFFQMSELYLKKVTFGYLFVTPYQCTMYTLSLSMKLQQLPEADADALLRLPADSES